ncbi:cytochrome P460 family protein, partial [Cupriavidus sp. YR651]|uniref:cytochrome P460 family protein n=1 Tax=Cupriavidus sp. YR651 TaxID=1855315 RepID=UPI00115FA991
YQMLGTWAVAADNSPGSKEMHVVYASPGTIAAYRKSGRFPDGTVLVKEVFKTTTKSMTTGTVSSAGTLAGWFVMVKDDVGRFPKNELWGDGWGWAWFDSTDPTKTTSTDYKKDCQSCHVPARASDWIYTHGYPPLSRLRQPSVDEMSVVGPPLCTEQFGERGHLDRWRTLCWERIFLSMQDLRKMDE